MFDSVATSRPRRPAAGSAVSIAIHVAAIGAAVWFTTRSHPPKIIEQLVPLPPGPRGGATNAGPPAKSQGMKQKDRRRPPTNPVAQATRPFVLDVTPLPKAEPAGSDSGAGEDSSSVVVRGLPDGLPGGGGIGDETSTFSPGPRVFEAGRMTPPRQISGPDPEYTQQALEREVEGTMAVECVVTEEGSVHGCRVLKSLPYMDGAVIRALERRRYTPALVDGRPVEVEYLFHLRLRLPTP